MAGYEAALDGLLRKREALAPWPVRPYDLPAFPRRAAPSGTALWGRFQRWEQLPDGAADRLERREGGGYGAYRDRWVPLEEAYYRQYGIPARADLILRNG